MINKILVKNIFLQPLPLSGHIGKKSGRPTLVDRELNRKEEIRTKYRFRIIMKNKNEIIIRKIKQVRTSEYLESFLIRIVRVGLSLIAESNFLKPTNSRIIRRSTLSNPYGFTMNRFFWKWSAKSLKLQNKY